MNIERLTKTQIVLLTLLVSFVTSIATGIVTVTLLDQAPPAVTQTVNRVVERTVERVVPDRSQGASVVTKETEKTVVVKEEDLITDSIEKNRDSIVRISTRVAKVDEEGTPLGVGVVVSEGGLIATDAGIVGAEGEIHRIRFADGDIFDGEVVYKREGNPIALLEIQRKEVGTPPPTFDAATLGDVSALKLGQTVLAISGVSRTNVGIGIIAALIPHTDADGNETGLSYIETTLSGEQTTKGSPLLNIFGEVVGLHTSTSRSASGARAYSPESLIADARATYHRESANAASDEPTDEE